MYLICFAIGEVREKPYYFIDSKTMFLNLLLNLYTGKYIFLNHNTIELAKKLLYVEHGEKPLYVEHSDKGFLVNGQFFNNIGDTDDKPNTW